MVVVVLVVELLLPLADLIYFQVRSVRLGRDQYKRTIEAVRLFNLVLICVRNVRESIDY